MQSNYSSKFRPPPRFLESFIAEINSFLPSFKALKRSISISDVTSMYGKAWSDEKLVTVSRRQRNWMDGMRRYCFVWNSKVASVTRRNSRARPRYWKTWTAMFDTAAIVDDSVISQCFPFLPPDFDEKATTATLFSTLVARGKEEIEFVRTFSNHNTIISYNKPIITKLKRTKTCHSRINQLCQPWYLCFHEDVFASSCCLRKKEKKMLIRWWIWWLKWAWGANLNVAWQFFLSESQEINMSNHIVLVQKWSLKNAT